MSSHWKREEERSNENCRYDRMTGREAWLYVVHGGGWEGRACIKEGGKLLAAQGCWIGE